MYNFLVFLILSDMVIQHCSMWFLNMFKNWRYKRFCCNVIQNHNAFIFTLSPSKLLHMFFMTWIFNILSLKFQNKHYLPVSLSESWQQEINDNLIGWSHCESWQQEICKVPHPFPNNGFHGDSSSNCHGIWMAQINPSRHVEVARWLVQSNCKWDYHIHVKIQK